MRLVVLREIPEDTHLRQQWNALAERVDQPQVFYTYEWALAVQRSYHAKLSPLVFLAYDEQESLRGVVALATTEGAPQRASFLCATTGDYCDFLSLAGERSAFVNSVLAELQRQGIRAVALANLPADSGTAMAIRQAAGQHGFHVFVRTAYVCAQVSLASLDRKNGERPEIPRRKMIRRFLRIMGREAPVRLDHARSWEAIQPILPEFIRSHVARFLATGRISNMARVERRVFLEELAKLLSESGWLTLTRMMSGDKSLAWNYGFQFHGNWFWYQPTFDSGLEKYSPGFCLLAQLIDEAASNPAINTVDLGLGAEEYKDRFTTHTRETLYVMLEDSIVAHYREMIRYRAVTMVKALPRLEAVVRKVVVRLQGLRNHFVQEGFARSVTWLGRRMGESVWSETEVFFYEWSGSVGSASPEMKLQPLDLNQLADAAAQYADDPSTLAYLLRSAERLCSQNAKAFALVDCAGTFLHFAWTTAFDGFFLAELNARVDAPPGDSVMLFDCWTPSPQRGRGYYGRAIGLIANQTKANGKRPWIFSAAANVSSVRGVEKAGFQRRYSLVRQRILGWQRIKGRPPSYDEVAVEQVSSAS